MVKNDFKSSILHLVKGLDRLELSHFEIKQALRNYKNPNKKIFDLVRGGDLIRIQRGIYRPRSDLVDIPPSPEILAQMLHGPSYISLERALSHYGLIPERVDLVSSVTLKRKRRLSTEFGSFEYLHLSRAKYSIGFTSEKQRRNSYLIATPLKALVDLIYFRVDKKTRLDPASVQDLLEDDFRLSVRELKIDRQEFANLTRAYRRVETVRQVLEWLSRARIDRPKKGRR